jgi:cell division protein FtsL
MAERSYQYSREYMEEVQPTQGYAYSENVGHDQIVVSRPFRRRFKNVTNLEKALVLTILITFCAMSIATVTVRNKINGITNQTVLLNQKNVETVDKINDLKQEVNELSRRERVEKIAKEKGLTLNDGNITKVKQP